MGWCLASELRRGSALVGDFEVHGAHLENKGGEKTWRIDIWRSGRNPVRHYCVNGAVIYRAHQVLTSHPDYPMAWEREEGVAEIDAAERQAIFDAIARWTFKES
jgi:hypothetical protein